MYVINIITQLVTESVKKIEIIPWNICIRMYNT